MYSPGSILLPASLDCLQNIVMGLTRCQRKQTNYMRLIKESVELNTSLQEVWSILENFGAVAQWVPSMKRSYLIGEQKTGVGTRRKLHHAWGFRMQETVTEWSTGHSFSFDVMQVPFPMKDVRETWVIEHENSQTTVATSVSYDMRFGVLGMVLDALVVQHIVRREMRTGLVGLKQYAERTTRRTKKP